MLNLVLYSQTNQLFAAEFKEKYLNPETIVIVPGPHEADLLRAELPSTQIISIAHYISKLFNICFEAEITRKSALLLKMYKLWLEINGEDNLHAFDEGYRYLTELRNNISFEDAYDSVADLFDINRSKFLKQAARFIEGSEINDEAKVYRKLRNEASLKSQKIILWGFKFVNSLQVDFLNELARENEVIVLYPEQIADNAKDIDWVKWLNIDQSDRLKGEGHTQECRRYYANPSQLGDVLTKFPTQDIVIFNSSLTSGDLYFYTSLGYGKKEAVQFFEAELNTVFKKLKASRNPLSFLDSQISYSIEKQKHKKLKVCLMIKKKIQELIQQQGLSENMVYQHLEIIKNIVGLDLPRVSALNFIPKRDLYLGGELFFTNGNNKVGYLAQDYLGRSKSDLKLSLELREALTSLGIIKREGLINDFLNFQLDNFSRGTNNILLIDPDAAKDELMDFEVEALNVPSKSKNLQCVLKPNQTDSTKRYSASRLQKFIDCPKQYYYTYIEKVIAPKKFEEEVNALDLGTMTHNLIRHCFEKKTSPKPDFIRSYLDETVLSQKQLPELSIRILVAQLVLRVSNGLSFLDQLIKSIPPTRIEFEKEVRSENFKGYIDLYYESSAMLLLIDFKASSNSIPDFGDVKTHNKIQLSAYGSRVDTPKEKALIYLCLDSIADSLVLSDKKLEWLEKTRVLKIDEFLQTYKVRETQLIKQIIAEEAFLPKPLKPETCRWCAMSNVCEKS